MRDTMMADLDRADDSEGPRWLWRPGLRSRRGAGAVPRTAHRWRAGTGGLVRILYVEDNDDNIYVVRNRLTRGGHTVLVAVDGAQGLAMAAAERPDLILMDLSLPVLDGWEVTRRLKAAPETRDIPI